MKRALSGEEVAEWLNFRWLLIYGRECFYWWSQKGYINDEITSDLSFVYSFVGDLLVASKNETEYLEPLSILFSKLSEYGLCIKVKKCQFFKSVIEFLRFKQSAHGIEPLPERVKCILEFPQPTTLTQLRHYLGFFNFYRRCIPKAANILEPLDNFLGGLKNKKKYLRSNSRSSTEQL
ncbi:transposon Ty3-I Gag-Pol polyprotein [Nephila pilipes]|uniref:Transposon Ty3-I Gag-Pol polyprotein n=1 Tax=Nephila pilipes TaxID=299642 RepID=A0A8X6MSP3_NEPPI|nr:transposon Ty3-I Gag-Pol polyprotein [Nephila pilipes]